MGDLFAVGNGVERSFQSLPVVVSSEGRARNCCWPMPCRKSARITVTTKGEKPVFSFYSYVDWSKLPALAEHTPCFHSMYRQEHPTVMGRNYLLADIEGKGHYVGTVVNIRQREPNWYGEGEGFLFINGEPARTSGRASRAPGSTSASTPMRSRARTDTGHPAWLSAATPADRAVWHTQVIHSSGDSTPRSR